MQTIFCKFELLSLKITTLGQAVSIAGLASRFDPVVRPVGWTGTGVPHLPSADLNAFDHMFDSNLGRRPRANPPRSLKSSKLIGAEGISGTAKQRHWYIGRNKFKSRYPGKHPDRDHQTRLADQPVENPYRLA
jgi:hypothetical protein